MGLIRRTTMTMIFHINPIFHQTCRKVHGQYLLCYLCLLRILLVLPPPLPPRPPPRGSPFRGRGVLRGRALGRGRGRGTLGPAPGAAGPSTAPGGATTEDGPRRSQRQRNVPQRPGNVYPDGTTVDKDLRKQPWKGNKLVSVTDLPKDVDTVKLLVDPMHTTPLKPSQTM